MGGEGSDRVNTAKAEKMRRQHLEATADAMEKNQLTLDAKMFLPNLRMYTDAELIAELYKRMRQ